MRKNSFTVLAVLTAALSVFLSTCKDAGELIQVEEGGPGIILPGVGMEGVKLGDSKEEVLSKLGNPTVIGFADGQYRSWRSFDYYDGPHAGLAIDFLEEPDGSFGPVDAIAAATPSGTQYGGKTKEGIGIGSELKAVHQAYGMPEKTLNGGQGYIRDYYCAGKKEFIVGYQDSLVTTMFIGYHVKMPNDYCE
ncbi:MAG: hypothetical protein WB699_15970 [Bacteroidota bacterium]